MADDSNRPDDPGGALLDLGEQFLNAIGSGDAGTEWREEVNESLTGEGQIDYDALVTAGIAAAEQTSRMRQQSRRTAAATDSTTPAEQEQGFITDVRDVHDNDGEYAGTRVLVSDATAEAYLSAGGDEVAVRAGSEGTTVELPREAAGIVAPGEDDDTVGEFIAYVAGGVLDPDAPTAGKWEAADPVEPEDSADGDE